MCISCPLCSLQYDAYVVGSALIGTPAEQFCLNWTSMRRQDAVAVLAATERESARLAAETPNAIWSLCVMLDRGKFFLFGGPVVGSLDTFAW